MIERLVDMVFKKRIMVEQHPQDAGWLPDERRFLWAMILVLVISQLLMIHYLATFPEQINQKIDEINTVTGAYGNVSFPAFGVRKSGIDYPMMYDRGVSDG